MSEPHQDCSWLILLISSILGSRDDEQICQDTRDVLGAHSRAPYKVGLLHGPLASGSI